MEKEGSLTRIFATNVKPVGEASRRVRLVVAFLVLCFVSACTKQVACLLHNNSGVDVTVIRSRAGDQDQRIDVKAGSSIVLRDWAFWSHRVDKADRLLRYAPVNPGNRFVDVQGFGPWTKRIFNAQLDPDGRIFVLNPGQAMPAKDFVEQPPGLPLVPIIE